MNRRLLIGAAAALVIGAALLGLRLLSPDDAASGPPAGSAASSERRFGGGESFPAPASAASASFGAAESSPALAREAFREAAPDSTTIRGLVVDAFDRPIAAADVWIAVDGGETSTERTQAGADGEFRLKTARRKTAFAVHAGAKGRITARRFVYRRMGADPDEIVIRLDEACTLTGRVIDDAGLPVGGVAVTITAKDEDQFNFERQRTTSDADGRFRLDAAPFGTCSLTAEIAGRLPAQVEIYLRGDAEQTIVLPTTAAGSVVLELEIVGLDASVGSTATVSVSAYAPGTPRLMPVPSGVSGSAIDAAGRWTSPPLADLRYQLVPTAVGYEFAPPVVVRNVGQPSKRVRIQAMRAATIELRGRLVDQDGAPLRGVTIGAKALSGAQESEAVTEDDGTFVLRSPLKAGSPCYVTSDGAAYVLAQPKDERTAVLAAFPGAVTSADETRDRVRYLTTADPSKPWTLRAEAAARVAGIVRTDSGLPIRFATVRLLESVEGGGLALRADARTDSEGRFVFPRLRAAAGEMRVALGLDPASPTSPMSPPFRTTPGRTTETVLHAPPPGTVEGRVTWDDEPLPGARVRIRRYSAAAQSFADRWFVERVADRQGRFRFADIPPGDYVFIAGPEAPPQEIPRGGSFVVVPGGAVSQDVALP